jgi:hypothetical protein
MFPQLQRPSSILQFGVDLHRSAQAVTDRNRRLPEQVVLHVAHKVQAALCDQILPKTLQIPG